jgi:hypothetical protein
VGERRSRPAAPRGEREGSVVVVIHEIFGLTDWIRAVANQLAAEGFIAVAPDLLSGKGPGGGGTEAFASRDDTVRAVSDLPREEVIARLDSVRTWALALPAAARTSATVEGDRREGAPHLHRVRPDHQPRAEGHGAHGPRLQGVRRNIFLDVWRRTSAWLTPVMDDQSDSDASFPRTVAQLDGVPAYVAAIAVFLFLFVLSVLR